MKHLTDEQLNAKLDTAINNAKHHPHRDLKSFQDMHKALIKTIEDEIRRRQGAI